MLPRNNLIGYALRYWEYHYHDSGSHRPVVAAMGLFQDTPKLRAWTGASYVISNPFTRIHRSYFSPMPYMAMLGLEDLVMMQIENEKSSGSFQKDCWLAIIEASRNGHKATVDLLLRHVEIDETRLGEELQWAASYGDANVLDSLISKAQEIGDFQWPRYLLARAAAAGLDNLVSALVLAGYDMNEEDASSRLCAVHHAAMKKKIRVLELFSSHGGDLTLKDSFGDMPLMLAVHLSAPETVQYLLDAKVSIDSKDNDDHNEWTLVQRAVQMGQHKSLEMLIKAGADFESGEMKADEDKSWARIPIVQASALGYQECTRILLDHVADPNALSQQGSALYVAINKGSHVEICRMLLEKGAEPNQSAADNEVYIGKRMTLTRAIKTNNIELVALLLEKGAKVNCVDPSLEKQDTPLADAAAFPTPGMVELLLRWGADVNFVSEAEASSTPLWAAAHNSLDPRCIEVLLEHGANVHWRSKVTKMTPLIASYCKPDHITPLLKHGSDINAVDRDGYSILMCATEVGGSLGIKTLLQHMDPRPDLELQAGLGWTALFIACYYVEPECVWLLLEAGADVNHRNTRGFSSLAMCLISSNPRNSEKAVQVSKLLLEYRHCLDVLDDIGGAILHNITTETPVSVVKFLVEAGAPANTVEQNGYTPLATAIECGNIEVAEYLLTVEGVRTDICPPSSSSILLMAVRRARLHAVGLVKQLIAAGVDHTILHPTTGESVLYSVVNTEDSMLLDEDVNMLQYLVGEVHVDVNAGAKGKYPILQALLGSQDVNILKYLLRHRGSIEVTDEFGRGPGHYVAMDGWTKAKFAVLHKAGADFLAKDKFGRTPLHFAALFCHEDSLRYILETLSSREGGFDVNVTDLDGWTPLVWTCRRPTWMNELPSIAALLVDSYAADYWARSTDGKWSALKLARYHQWDEMDLLKLQPLEAGATRRSKDGKEEVWDPTSQVLDEKPSSHNQNGPLCIGCNVRIKHPPSSQPSRPIIVRHCDESLSDASGLK